MSARIRQQLVLGRDILFGLTLVVMTGCWEEIHYTPTAADSAASDRAKQEPAVDRHSPPATSDTTPSASSPPSVLAENPDEAANGFADDVAAKLAARTPAELTAPQVPPAPVSGTGEGKLVFTDESLAIAPQSAEAPSASAPATTVAQTGPPIDADPAHSSRRIAWLLGNKLSLSALANDRGGADEETAKLFSQAQTLAEMLDVKVSDLPPVRTATATNANFDRAIQYLFAQGQPIGRALATRYGDDHAALFELAVKSNLLLALYRPHASVVGALSAAIEQAGGRSGLPVKLWQPLMDAMANSAAVDDVRQAVYRLQSDADKYLASPH
ncbi:MAG TPA: hypothetical protein VGM76_14040 [Lacipirellulaceae bacterium]|jgi:uncharacterized protein YoxC